MEVVRRVAAAMGVARAPPYFVREDAGELLHRPGLDEDDGHSDTGYWKDKPRYEEDFPPLGGGGASRSRAMTPFRRPRSTRCPNTS